MVLGGLLASRSRAMRAVEHATLTLRSTEQRFETLVRYSNDLIVILSPKGELLYASPSARRSLGFVKTKRLGRSVLELVHPDDREAVRKSVFTDAVGPGPHNPAVFRFATASGEWRFIEATVTNCLDEPAVAGIVVNARDITERTNLTRALRTLGESNQVLVKASDETALLDDTCDIIVDTGKYQLAWVGYAEHDEAHTVRPMAWAGASDYVRQISVSWSDDEHGQGPAGTAIRTRTVRVVGDVNTAKEFAPWRGAAAEVGIRSVCALPLEVRDEVIGMLAIYAAEPNAFGLQEVALLKELADALAYGVGRIRDADMLRASEERFRSLAGAGPIGILELSPVDGIIYANPRIAEITGTNVEALMGRKWIHSVLPEDISGLLEAVNSVDHVDRADPDRAKVATTFRIQRPGGEVRHVRILAAPKGEGFEGGYVVTVEDITDEVESREALRYQAFYDTLTGLPNRALFVDRLNQELARNRRDDSNIAVLFLDLDRFKIVNDSLGHETGDAVLKEVGDRFKGEVRSGETVAHFSGDEFVFIIRDVLKVEDAVSAAKRLQEVLGPPIRYLAHDLTVTGSIGIVIPANDSDAAMVLRDADAAMYQAKAEGRNRYAVFDEVLHRRSVWRLAMEGELRQALARNEFELYYQPFVDPLSERLMGAEALIRWHHPTRGLVPPQEFIPIAEESGLIKPIGRWVFAQAISQLASWDAQDGGPRLGQIAVNLSAVQLGDPDTSTEVRDVLERSGIAPSRVIVEITESVVMADDAATRRSLEDFKRLGLHVAIDDFGTGYSSLAYLHRLPVTTLKVDGSFVERLGSKDDSTPVVKAIIEMAHALGLFVVAEGVGNEYLRDLISVMGCDAAQGFYWAWPMPAEKVALWCRDQAIGPTSRRAVRAG